MPLNFGKVPNRLFSNTREEELGIAYNEKGVSQSAVKSFIVGGPSEQYSITTSFAEVTGMTITHESKTGKVLVVYSCTTSPGVSEFINIKLQKDGVDVTGTEQEVGVSSNPGTTYLGVPAAAFQGRNPNNDDFQFSSTGASLLTQENGIIYVAQVNLPHGATITGAIVYGNASATAETWTLNRVNHTGGGATLGTANIGTEDTSIANATINNNSYIYTFATTSLDTNDVIYNARITYTPSQFSFQGENPFIPTSIHYTETNAGKNTWRIMAKTSQFTPADSFINDRVLTIIDI